MTAARSAVRQRLCFGICLVALGCAKSRVQECKMLVEAISQPSSRAERVTLKANEPFGPARLAARGRTAQELTMEATKIRALELRRRLTQLKPYDPSLRSHVESLLALIERTERTGEWNRFAHEEAKAFGGLMGDCAMAR